jgi:large subunit ribosomal protein L21
MAKIAIIETGGKQYVVTDGSVLTVEKITGSSKGSKVSFDKVLLVDDGSKITVGAPHISGAKVSAEIMEEGKADKVRVIRYRQKSRYFKKKGHRQPYAKIKITALP